MSTAPADPFAPSLVWLYKTPRRALIIRSAYTAATPWTDSAGVRACLVIGLDDYPERAKKAFVEWREGSARRKGWVAVADLASTKEAAIAKLAPHLSALLAAERPAKMPVMTAADSAEQIPDPAPAPTPAAA